MSERTINDAFGQRVRAAMAVARISRQEMARACNVSPQAVQRWCDGTAYPTSGNLMTICDMTGCSVEWLMWPHPVDMRSTEWAQNGTHIKNIVRTVMDELAKDTSGSELEWARRELGIQIRHSQVLSDTIERLETRLAAYEENGNE